MSPILDVVKKALSIPFYRARRREEKQKEILACGGALVLRSKTALWAYETIMGQAPHDKVHACVPRTETADACNYHKCDNKVKTHRMHMALFIPYSFFEQLLSPTNFYYFVLGWIQLIPAITDSDGVPTNWLPISAVITVSMIKEGVEEWKRHRADRAENNQLTMKLDEHGEWIPVRWREVQPGDILLLREADPFPADLIMLSSSDKFGICNVETKQLDGESNLKIKSCIPELSAQLFDTNGHHASGEQEAQYPAGAPPAAGSSLEMDSEIAHMGRVLKNKVFEIYHGPPSSKLYHYTGMLSVYPESADLDKVLSPSAPDHITDLIVAAEEQNAQVYPLNISQFLWRGASLQATEWVIGMTVYTGKHTRLFMNNSDRRGKKTKLQRTVMSHIFTQCILDGCCCLIMAILSATTVPVVSQHWYLFSNEDSGYSGYESVQKIDGKQSSNWTYRPDISDFVVSFLSTIGRMVLLLSYLIPVTLIVQIEMSHLFQGTMMQKDPMMTVEETAEECQERNEREKTKASRTSAYKGISEKKRAKMLAKSQAPLKMGCTVNSNDILDDLGCITHVFSDKTGTLTQNIMEFKAISICQTFSGAQDSEEVIDLGFDEHADASSKKHSKPAKAKCPVPYVDFSPEEMSALENDEWRQVHKDFLLCLAVCHSVVIKNRTTGVDFNPMKSVAPNDDPMARESRSGSEYRNKYLGAPGDLPRPSQSSEAPARSMSFTAPERGSVPQYTINKMSASLKSPNMLRAESDNFEAEIKSNLMNKPDIHKMQMTTSHRTRQSIIVDKGDPCSPKPNLPSGTRVSEDSETHAGPSTCQMGVCLYPISRSTSACYDASSPDELALVCAAKALGVEFVQRPSPDRITLALRNDKISKLFLDDSSLKSFSAESLRAHNMPFTDVPLDHSIARQRSTDKMAVPGISFRILDVLEFDNYRKRMSVIIRDELGQIVLLCKGADCSMLSKAKPSTTDNTKLQASILRHSKAGLRTLVFGRRVIDEAEYQDFARHIMLARKDQDDDSDPVVQEILSKIESNLDILGSTGVNDRLQEECPETISAIKAAGIQLWVLTGDKVETAISIGMSTNLLTQDTFNSIIDANNLEDVYRQIRAGIIYIISAKLGGKGGNFETSKKKGIMDSWNAFMDMTKFTEETTAAESGGVGNFVPSKITARQLQNALDAYLDAFASEVPEQQRGSSIDIGGNPGRNNSTSNSRSSSIIDVSQIEAQASAEGARGVAFASSSEPNLIGRSSGQFSMNQLMGDMDNLAMYNEIGLTVTGSALDIILQDDHCCVLFYALANLCAVVIACRVSPLQKALVVQMSEKFYKGLPNRSFCSLAVGDGANDVNMIMTANVGVGIKGKEGSQAARTADIAIQEFRHLCPLLFIHGHEALRRNSFMIYHTLWKNTFFGATNFFYAFTCLYSGVDIYNLWIKQLYNLVFTSLPIMYYCMFDRYLPHHIMVKYSELYPIYSRPDGGMYFGKKWYMWWTVLGFGAAAAVTFFPIVIVNYGGGPDGIIYTSLDTYGQTIYTATVVLGCITVAPFISCWSAFMVWSPILVLVGYYVIWFALSSSIQMDVFTSWSINQLPTYHYSMFFSVLVVLFPLLVWYIARIIFRPSRQTIITERLRLGVHDLIIGKIMPKNYVLAPAKQRKATNFVFAEEQGMNRLTLIQEVEHRRAGSSSSSFIGSATPQSVTNF